MIAAGVWLLLVAAFITTIHAVGHHQQRRARRPEPLTLHTPRETPGDAEWRRRIQRWRAEQDDIA